MPVIQINKAIMFVLFICITASKFSQSPLLKTIFKNNVIFGQ
jgi:hypothetical protein